MCGLCYCWHSHTTRLSGCTLMVNTLWNTLGFSSRNTNPSFIVAHKRVSTLWCSSVRSTWLCYQSTTCWLSLFRWSSQCAFMLNCMCSNRNTANPATVAFLLQAKVEEKHLCCRPTATLCKGNGRIIYSCIKRHPIAHNPLLQNNPPKSS